MTPRGKSLLKISHTFGKNPQKSFCFQEKSIKTSEKSFSPEKIFHAFSNEWNAPYFQSWSFSSLVFWLLKLSEEFHRSPQKSFYEIPSIYFYALERSFTVQKILEEMLFSTHQSTFQVIQHKKRNNINVVINVYSYSYRAIGADRSLKSWSFVSAIPIRHMHNEEVVTRVVFE